MRIVLIVLREFDYYFFECAESFVDGNAFFELVRSWVRLLNFLRASQIDERKFGFRLLIGRMVRCRDDYCKDEMRSRRSFIHNCMSCFSLHDTILINLVGFFE